MPIFFILLMLTANGAAYGWTVDELKARYKGEVNSEEVPVFADEKYIVKADDGTTVVIRKSSPDYDKLFKRESGFSSVRNEETGEVTEYYLYKDIYYYVLCADENHILLIFDDDNDYLEKHKDTLKLEKHGDFENVSSYKFTYLTYSPNVYELDKRILATELIWLDKKTDEYCGSFKVIYHRNTPEDRRYYNYVKDFYLFVMYEEIDRCTKMLDNDIDYVLNRSQYYPYSAMMIFDKGLITDELKDRVEFLELNQNKSIRDRNANNTLLKMWSVSVSDALSIFANRFPQEFLNKRLNMEGDYPVNDIELDEYLRWLAEAWQFISKDYFKGFIDVYGTPVKYEIIPEGLKVTSAGKDKVFGTEDDQYILREYKD